MRKYLFIITFLFIQKSFSQERVGNFEFYGKNTEFKYLDYSAYGGFQLTLYITSDVNDYLKVYNNSKSKLSNYDDVYHSYYFFLLIPEHIKTLTQKEYFVFEFIKCITNSYNNKVMLINFFMDEDYTKLIKLKSNEIIFEEARFNIKKSTEEFYKSLIGGFKWQNDR